MEHIKEEFIDKYRNILENYVGTPNNIETYFLMRDEINSLLNTYQCANYVYKDTHAECLMYDDPFNATLLLMRGENIINHVDEIFITAVESKKVKEVQSC